ncbi:MAG: sulfatase [Verrucomicrobiales bacterium]|nr:sulfatase [Verrucomicrobiales bacterium]
MHARHLSRILLFAVTLSFCSYSSATEKPNIVFFLADDLGWTGLRCVGSDFYETPNLDRLAGEGMKFTDAYAACTVCSPTRASVLTGKYPGRLHLTSFIPGQERPYAKLRTPDWTKGLETTEETLPELLRVEGYRTHHLGKWHLDFPDRADEGPTSHGFDTSVDKPKNAKGYFFTKEDREELDTESTYATDFFAEKAVELIDQGGDDPFFLYFAFHVPHTPIQGREDLVAYFEEKVDPEAIHQNPVYAAMVKSMDMAVGKVLEALEANGISDETLIIFTSDNGGLTQRHGKHDRFTENLPLRRGKGSAYEGGVRVPAIVKWPGHTEAGSSSSTPIMTIDWLPTITDIAGAEKVPDDIDGENLRPLLEGSPSSLDRDLFWHFPHYHAGGDGPYSAIRSGDWKLIERHESGTLELYNLSSDLEESNDLSASKKAKADRLHRKLKAWRKAAGAQMMTSNPDFAPAKAQEAQRRKK